MLDIMSFFRSNKSKKGRVVEKNDFINLQGIGARDEVLVSAIELQKLIRAKEDLENKLENVYLAEEKARSELEYLKEEVSGLRTTNSQLLTAASTNKKLLVENEDLKYRLGLSNMFLERRKEREALNAYKSNIRVDLTV